MRKTNVFSKLSLIFVFAILLFALHACSSAAKEPPVEETAVQESAEVIAVETLEEPIEPEDPWQTAIDSGDALFAEEIYEEALASFQNAIAIDASKKAAYEKAADCCVALDDVKAAISLLQTGFEATGDAELQEKITKVQEDWNARPIVCTIFLFSDVYKEEIESIFAQYPNMNGNGRGVQVQCMEYGIRFPEPVQFYLDGELCETEQADLIWSGKQYPELIDLIYTNENWQIVAGPIIGKQISMTGYFTRDENYVRVSEPEEKESSDGSKAWVVSFNPNGEYMFHMLTYEVLEDTATN